MTGIALPRARRRRRKPFGPREKRALAWLCIGVFCVVVDFGVIVHDMEASDFDGWTVFDVLAIAYWSRLVIPAEWKVIRAWLDSEDG